MKKRILIIHDYHHSEGGGLEVQAFLDAKELVKRGCRVRIASSRTSSDTYSSKFIRKKDGVDFSITSSKKELTDLIDNSNIIHVRSSFSLRKNTMNALKILNKKNRDYIVSIHSNLSHLAFSQMPKEEKEKRLKDFTSYLSSPKVKIIGVSNSIKKSLEEIGLIKSLRVINNSKDWKTFKSNPRIKNIPFVDVTYVGGISLMKGVHVLLQSLIIIKKTMPKIKVRIIGGGTSKKELLLMIEMLGLKKNIEYIETVENEKVPNYLVRTKILTLPSLTESWGNIVMEAMGLGTTTVSSKIEGLIELTENGKLGFLCDKGDAEDFAKTFLGVLNETLTLDYSKINIKNYIQKKYSMKNRIDKLEMIYNQSPF